MPRSRACRTQSAVYRVVIVVLCIAGQVGWMAIGWGVDGRDWTPP